MVVAERVSYNKLEKRPAEVGLFIGFRADGQYDYFYPRGILRREGAGRSWAIKTPQISLGWEEAKQVKDRLKTNKREAV